jgi:BASS family bile acid:Na+ symporter
LKKNFLFKICLGISLASLLLAFYLYLIQSASSTGPFVIGAIFFLGIAFQGFQSLKRFTYTTMILAAVSCSLYYPGYFLEWNGFKLSRLIVPLLQVIMFGMGTSMSLNDFVSVVKSPKGVFIGVASQFIIMPMLGFLLANISGFEPEIAAGIILIGCSPSGLASNVMAFLAKANLALSLTITSITTILAPFVTPMLMDWLGGAYIKIDVAQMMKDISNMILLPIAVGIIFNRLFSGKVKWLEQAMPLVSMAGIALIIVVITAAGRDSLLQIGPLLILLTLIHNIGGYFLGYWSARLFKMKEGDARTVAIEVGMQNGGLASGIAKELGKIATVGLAPAVFGPLMNVTGSILASYWHERPPAGSEQNGQPPSSN